MDDLDRPGAVTAFLWLWALVIVLSLIVFLAVASEAQGSDVVIGLISNAIQIALVVLCARRHDWARWVLAVLYALGLILFLFQAGAIFSYSSFVGVANVAGYVAGGAGIILAFTPAASHWFTSRPKPEIPPALAARRRRTMIAAASTIGVIAVLGIGYAIWNPDFTDWEPIRERCFAEAEDAAARDTIAACTEMIDSERFEGAELAAIHMRSAELHVAADQLALAARDFQGAASADPTNLQAWRSLAQTRLDQGYPSLAVRPAEQAIELAPDDAELRGLLGRALFLSERYEDAVTALQAATAQLPDSAEPFAYLAATNNRLGHYDAALDAISSALALEPDNAGYLVVYSDALAYAGRHAEALENYRRVIELMPDAVDGLLGMATSHCAMGAMEEARAYIDQMFDKRLIREIHLQNLMASVGIMDEVGDDITASGATWSFEIGPETEAALQTWMAQGCPMPPPVTDG